MKHLQDFTSLNEYQSESNSFQFTPEELIILNQMVVFAIDSGYTEGLTDEKDHAIVNELAEKLSKR